MAINIRCQCGGEAKLSAKKCPRCGSSYPKHGRKYKVTVRLNGKKITRTVGNLSLARDVEGKLKIDVVRNEHRLNKVTAPTLAVVWEKYLTWAKENKPKSVATDIGYYSRHLEPRLANKRLDGICQLDIERLMSDMRKGLSKRGRPFSPTTIKHVVVLLGRLYSIAERWGMYKGENPCKKVNKPKINNQITEYLDNEELNRLVETLNKWENRMSACFVLFLLYTGLRRGELFKLKWSDVNMTRGAVTLKDPKGKVDTTIPISQKAIDVLNNLPREFDTPFVFYGKNGKQRADFSGPWKRIRKASDLPSNFRLHGLRHHFASSLVSAGVDLFTVSKLLTHKDVKTTQRYAHLQDQTLRDAVVLSDKLQTPIKNEFKAISLVRKNA